MHSTSTRAATAIIALLITLSSSSAIAQPVTFVGLGDSIGEGVQSGDASQSTQPYSFLNMIAAHMGAPFPLPLIRTGLFASVGDMADRSRINPSVRTYNLAVSGADAHSILFDVATATTTGEIDSETELVLFPQVGSQIQVAEQLLPQYAAVWIGNNDALGAALAFDQLNGTQLTPVPQFTADFTQLVQRLNAMGTKAVFGTIPDITGIAFLLNRQDLIRFLGTDHGLPEGSLTSLPAMFLVRLGLLSPTVFADPNYVLDPAEQATISNHIALLNDVIRSVVAAHGMALADTHAVFDYISDNTLPLFGLTYTTRFLGGIFSLDGVHPSNFGHGVATLFFIDALNRQYGTSIPQLSGPTLAWLAVTDPFTDKDGDGRVTGRFGSGLLETLFSILGITGDTNDGSLPLASASTPSSSDSEPSTVDSQTRVDGRSATHALDEYARLTGRDLRRMSRDEQLDATRQLFGLPRGRQ
jgi:hypothetical protein